MIISFNLIFFNLWRLVRTNQDGTLWLVSWLPRVLLYTSLSARFLSLNEVDYFCAVTAV